MTTLARDAIVEAVAMAQYENDRTNRGGDGPFEWPEWPDLEELEARQYIANASLAVAAMQDVPVTVTSVEAWQLLEGNTPLRAADGDLCVASDLQGWMSDPSERESIFPLTILYPRPTPQADVLAEIRELHSPSERASGLACSECSAEMDVPHPCETILIIDEHEAKS